VSVRLALVVLAAGLLAAACGGQGSPGRSALARYVGGVDRVELALRAPLGAVSSAGDQFAVEERSGKVSLDNPVDHAREKGLLADAVKIQALRAQLSKIKAPPSARHLRALLLGLIDGQQQLTRELAKMVVFMPRFSAALTTLQPAMRRLEPILARRSASGSVAVAAVYASKAAALSRFAASLEQILARLRGLTPPAVSKPGYLTELGALQGMSTNAGRLARALRSGQTENLQPVLLAFDRAAASNQSTAAQKAQIAAVRAYDAQVAGLARISGSIEVERARLADTVR
jgi:hypothetical protein